MECQEWNIRLTSYDHGEIIQQIYAHLENEWIEAVPLTKDWVVEYAKTYQPPEKTAMFVAEPEKNLPAYVVPNQMQKAALANLAELRTSGAKKGLIVSATGTGKTFLAAFDVAQVKPKRMLFIVHREQILQSAMQSFKKVLGGVAADYGVLSGSKKETDAKYLFATIQTISKSSYQELFAKDYFDYVLVDEVHKAGAESYLTTLDYFTPKFLLGMTATPERTDGFNIFELFDYNVAYEIRLQEALEADFLCPFHYFGVTDYEVDGEVISETTPLQQLTTAQRVSFLLEKIAYYGCSKNQPKGLVFCSRKQEAAELSTAFGRQGVPSGYLSGEHSISQREAMVEQLERGELQYIFTVDIFNEGIDIPKINQVIMLRNTQSNIIFIQQLGRGLRKDPSKEFVTVIDFIGNYQNNYMIPMALSGDDSRNKNNLRKDTFETNYISGLSSINFEAIAKEQIFKSIDAAKLDSMKELKAAFYKLKNRLNRVPYLIDFERTGVMEPLVFANHKKGYYSFLCKVDENEGALSEVEEDLLLFVSRELLPGYRLHEAVILAQLLESDQLEETSLGQLFAERDLIWNAGMRSSVMRTLTTEFYTGGAKKAYQTVAFLTGDAFEIAPQFKQAQQNHYFVQLLRDLLLVMFEKNQAFNKHTLLTRYQKYRRRDVLRLLGWHEQMVDQNIGGYTYKNGKFAIFVTLEKGRDFKGALMAYEDELLSSSVMRWFTKAPRKLSSPEVQILLEPKAWQVLVFAKKSDDEGTDFYFLGEVTPVKETIQQLAKPIKGGTTRSVVEMELKFNEPIQTNLYKYLR